jgi:serine/threonine-protein kinase
LNIDANEPVLGRFLNGRYKIVQVLRTGDFGQTYVAQDSWLGSHPQCVIKFLQPQGDHPKRREICKRRFTSEAQALSQLGFHDQIPQLLDGFEDDQGFYLARELIIGEPLTLQLPLNHYDNKYWSEVKCVELLDDVLGILDFVHRQGMVHGDLKPSNLIRRDSDGRMVLVDFGVAHPIHPHPVKPQVIPIQPSSTPVAIPPLGYIPAEQFSGQLCPSSDIYALGMIAIQALTGLNPLQLQINPKTGEIDWEKPAGVSDSLARVLNKMVRYDCKSRYQSANDVRTALKRLLIKSEEEDVELEELSSVSASESPDAIAPTKAEELVWCFHHISQLPDNGSSPSLVLNKSASSVVKAKESEDVAREGNESSTSQTWDYAREIATACLPKLPPLLSGLGVGMATSNALAISFGMYTLLHTAPANPGLDLLERATEQYQAGNFDEALALAKSIPSDSAVYQKSLTTVQQWRSEWDKAAAQFQNAEQAFKEGRWRDLLEKARHAPNNGYWQHKLELLVEQAKPQVEAESQHLLKQAYKLAAVKDFAGALTILKQIPPETATGSKIQPKLKEYSHKQQIKAEHLLQQAYQRAAERDFKGALKYLSQVPEDTSTYETAQAKMAEYARKQTFQEEVDRQVQLNAQLPQEDIKISKLPQPSKSTKASSKLNPGNQMKEVTTSPKNSGGEKVKRQKSKV